MVLQNTVSILMGKGNYAYYSKIIPNLPKNEYYDVPLELARKSGHQKIKVQCDGCGQILLQALYQYKEAHSLGEGDYCTHCSHIKRRVNCLQKYGVSNPMQVEEFKEKQADTVENKYGCRNVFQNEDIKKKSRETNINKYGVDHLMKDPEVNHQRTIVRNRTIRGEKGPCSKGQLHLWELFGGELNYPLGYYLLDIYDETNKIDIEYDGAGHDLCTKAKGGITQKEFQQRECARYHYIKKQGIKQLRFIFKNIHHKYLPSDEILLQLKDFAYQLFESASVNWVHIELEDQFITTKFDTYKYSCENNNLLVHRND